LNNPNIMKLGKLLLLACAALSLTAFAQPKKIRIGVEGAYPPFSQIDPSGKLSGFDIDITNALCAEMKADCTLVQQAFDGMIPALQAKKIDAVIASMTITDERMRAVDFSDKYYQTPARFVMKKSAKLEATPAGLKGKKIGVQRATIHDRYVTDIFKSSQIVRYTKQDDAFLDLTAGRTDVALVDIIAAQQGFLKTPQGKDFEFAGPVYDDPKYFGVGAGVAMRKGDNALRSEFNRAIAAIRANGTYKKIQDKYFDFDVYGKDGGAAAVASTTAKPQAADAKKPAQPQKK
jgi:arginine/ornithine transport system substrate-binding protein